MTSGTEEDPSWEERGLSLSADDAALLALLRNEATRARAMGFDATAEALEEMADGILARAKSRD